MICMKTKMKEMPKNCRDCWVICELPYEYVKELLCERVKEEYTCKRHEDCPLVEIREES